MGTIKRLNDQQKQQAQAEAAMPGAYENRYDEGIQNALAGMDSANSAGLGFDSQNGTYRGALSRLFGNAGAGASAAEQVANSLSGGYGTDWAKSAAQQAAAGETGQTANVYAQARADALSQWQQELAGRGTQLDNLLTQDQLARSEYDGSVADAANLRNYRYGRTQQARQENSDFLSNVWNVVKNVGAAALEGYDAYKGYRQQDWENAFALRQYNDNLSRTELSDQMAALQQAASYKEAGFDDAAKQILNQYGLTDTMLDSWQGLSQVDKDKLDYLTTAAGLAGSGYDTAANNYLQMAGLPTGSVDSYSTIANRLNQADLAKYASQLAISNRYKTTTRSGSGGTSRSTKSGSSTKSRSSKVDGYTQPQLNTMFKEYSNMKPDDQRRSYYEDTLADAGRIQRLTGTGNPGKANGTAWEQGMYNARKMANSGYSQNQIANELANNTSLSSDQISAIMNQIDYEWRGTK
ncbi:MAG: hypothetical protein OGM78_08055 [Oscillospiraceae bacterium]|jgi:hypothetical protein|nr:MAG: hypothetical protein OGM78_08055 [Oscillospiraceae bacterium]